MKSAAIFLADGFEEIEALATVDILRRGGIPCTTIGVNGPVSTGSHGIPVTCDAVLEGPSLPGYDMIILPGGMPGAAHLRDDERVQTIIRTYDADPDKYVAAICAAPMALAAAGITKGRRVTSYPADEFKSYFGDADYVDDELVVVDGHLITSRGPATAFLFAYTLTDILGGDSKPLMQSMLVNMAAAKIRTMDI